MLQKNGGNVRLRVYLGDANIRERASLPQCLMQCKHSNKSCVFMLQKNGGNVRLRIYLGDAIIRERSS